MPVVSPSRYNSASSGTYRSSLSSANSLDNPYGFKSSSGTYVTSTLRSTIGDKTTEYRSRYSDVDGRRERKTSLVEYSRNSRAPSVTDSDSGISTRYRSERSESRSRDLSTTRSESGKTSEPRSKRNSNALSSAALEMSPAEFYDKYSPANYIPMTQRLKMAQNENYRDIARSKSITNDIGRPPADASRLRKIRNSAATISERPDTRRSYKESSPTPSYSKRTSMVNGIKDNNGNEVPSVSEIRKRFDPTMTITKLPVNDSRYLSKTSVDQYLNKLKDCENGTTGYTKLPKEEKPVPVHSYAEKNGISHKWESGSSRSRSNSNSDLSISKTLSEPVSLAKHVVDKNNSMSTSLTIKLPSNRLASIKSQLDPNNPIGKILEKSTVIKVENGDVDYNDRKKIRNSPEIKVKELDFDEGKIRNSPEIKVKEADFYERKIRNSPEIKVKEADFDERKIRNSPEIKVKEEDFDERKIRNSPEVKVKEADFDESKIRNSPEVKVKDSDFDECKIRNSPEIKVKETEFNERKSLRNRPEIKESVKVKKTFKNDIEKQVKSPKNTANLASYIKNAQPIASGTSSPVKKLDLNGVVDEELAKADVVPSGPRKSKVTLKYIDSEDDKLVLDNDIESPSGTGFENKTFEHENFLKRRNEKDDEQEKENDDGVKSMETSTESTGSEPTEDDSPSTLLSRKKILDKEYDDIKLELAGGRSGPSGIRRSSERSEVTIENRSDKTQVSGLNGLRNIGNTCFMNSVLQCLSNTRPLLEYVTQDKHNDEINTSLSGMKGALIKAFASVIKELWMRGERDSVVNTTSLKSQIQRFAPRFMGYSQQDAQEFLRYLLEGLHEDVNRVTIKPKPILTEIDDNLSDSAKAAEAWSRYLRMEDSHVGDIFIGQLKSTLRCTHCNHDSVTFDPFWDLSLPIPSRTGNLKLQQCLQHFTKEEELDGDEKPTCSKCGVRRKCLKWFTVQKFPQVLVLHLKRFSPLERFRGKLNVLVEFPLNGLDMTPYAATKQAHAATYNLYAVSNHSGTTYSGHYTAYCKHPYNGEWHEYNDSRVTPINPRNVVSSEAYVLFYERVRNDS